MTETVPTKLAFRRLSADWFALVDPAHGINSYVRVSNIGAVLETTDSTICIIRVHGQDYRVRATIAQLHEELMDCKPEMSWLNG